MIRLVLQVKNGVGLTFHLGWVRVRTACLTVRGIRLQFRDPNPNRGSYSESGIQVRFGTPTPNRGSDANRGFNSESASNSNQEL